MLNSWVVSPSSSDSSVLPSKSFSSWSLSKEELVRPSGPFLSSAIFLSSRSRGWMLGLFFFFFGCRDQKEGNKMKERDERNNKRGVQGTGKRIERERDRRRLLFLLINM